MTDERHIPDPGHRPPSEPYRSSPVFTHETLPAALQREHRTKRGVWGVIHVLDGSIRFCPEDGGPAQTVTPDGPHLIEPDAPHHVELIGPVMLRIDFFDHAPKGVVPRPG